MTKQQIDLKDIKATLNTLNPPLWNQKQSANLTEEKAHYIAANHARGMKDDYQNLPTEGITDEEIIAGAVDFSSPTTYQGWVKDSVIRWFS